MIAWIKFWLLAHGWIDSVTVGNHRYIGHKHPDARKAIKSGQIASMRGFGIYETDSSGHRHTELDDPETKAAITELTSETQKAPQTPPTDR